MDVSVATPHHFSLLLLLLTLQTQSFNIDVQHSMLITGPSDSYFGYTVALLNNSDGNWLLVGAPKANSTYLRREYGIKEPGVLFKCKLDEYEVNETQCSQIVVDPTGNSVFVPEDNEAAYKDLKDGGWLGVSLDVKPDNDSEIVVCAHQWKNQRYRLYYLTNGVCYTIPGSLDTRSVQKLTPLVTFNKQIIEPGIYYYAMGQAGFASHYTEQRNELLLGAPGICDWTGSVVYYPGKTENDHRYPHPMVPLPVLEKPEVIYFGYSLSSGKFFNSDNDIYLVVGAPRDDNTGTVYIISQPQGSSREAVAVKIRKEGTQMGEYFGASVCAVDLNNDGLSDLVVGAPHHAIRVNEGRIYVYINDGLGLLKPVKESILGDATVNSHFGTAVGVIGDINQDDYRDVAVGAPFEADGVGAVYVYHGTATGINPKYVQKILPQQINPQIKGFGISFSRGKDMDGNLYPDFGVGAFDSSHAVFFKTRPVIYLTSTMNFEPNQIATNASKCHSRDGSLLVCFTLETCFQFQGKWSPNNLDVSFSVELDSLGPDQKRGFFDMGNTTNLESVVTVGKNELQCVLHTVYLHDDIKDFLTPINFLLKFKVVDNPGKGFCKSCPIVDPSCALSHNKQIMFMKNCGEDETCEANLRVRGYIRRHESGQPFIIGSSTHLYVELTVSNEGEPAYQSTVQISAPPWVHFQRLPPNCVVQDDEFVAVCYVGNPLRSHEKGKLSVNVNVENVPSRAKHAFFNISVSTASVEKEENLVDNELQLGVVLKKVADIAIFGISSQEQIVSNSGATDAKLSFSHKYEVSKFEPSPIDSVTMEINLPIIDIEYKHQSSTLFNIRSIKLHESGNALFGSCQGIDQEILTTNRDVSQDSNKRLKRALRDKHSTVYNNLYTLNCSTVACHVIRCLLGNFIQNETLSIEVEFEAHVDNIEKFIANFKSVENIEFTSFGRVVINDEPSDIQSKNYQPDLAKVSTFFISNILKPKPISRWIIILSTLAGCLLLFTLIIVLVKLGFFRREKRDEMRSLMHASVVKSQQDSFAVDNLIFDFND